MLSKYTQPTQKRATPFPPVSALYDKQVGIPLSLPKSGVNSVVKPPRPATNELVPTVLAKLDAVKRAKLERHLQVLGIAPQYHTDFLTDVIGMIAAAFDSTNSHRD